MLSAEIIILPKPGGQAIDAVESSKYVKDNEPLLIGPCDAAMVWKKSEYDRMVKEMVNEESFAMIVWGFTQYASLETNPTAWGWLKTKGDKITDVSVKVPISDDPYNDKAIIGAFTFRNADSLKKLVDYLVKNDIRVKGEFYLDSCIKATIDLGLTAKIFLVDQYIGFGTPSDVKTVEYWGKFFIEGKSKIGGH